MTLHPPVHTNALTDCRFVPSAMQVTHDRPHHITIHVRAGPDPVTHQPVPTIGHWSNEAKPSKEPTGRHARAAPTSPRVHGVATSVRVCHPQAEPTEFKVGTTPKARSRPDVECAGCKGRTAPAAEVVVQAKAGGAGRVAGMQWVRACTFHQRPHQEQPWGHIHDAHTAYRTRTHKPRPYTRQVHTPRPSS